MKIRANSTFSSAVLLFSCLKKVLENAGGELGDVFGIIMVLVHHPSIHPWLCISPHFPLNGDGLMGCLKA